jgi:hypothetical protein
MFIYQQVVFLIANVIAIVLIARAFFEAAATGRIIILALFALSFIVPRVWPGIPVSLICFVVRVCLAIGCYIYLKWQHVSLL